MNLGRHHTLLLRLALCMALCLPGAASDSAGEGDRDGGNAAASGMLDAELHIAHQTSSELVRWKSWPHRAQST